MAKKRKNLKVNWQYVLLGLLAALALLTLLVPALPQNYVDTLHLNTAVSWFASVKAFIEANIIMIGVVIAVVVAFFIRGKK